jgi:NAD(P)H-nitrite reductase large subunit|uniref:NAD(P)/FAD-dependent oxidoreductase n=1 Tax=Desulfobacca acetoxidans TaxID=60893 RepID=A0A7C3V5K8_9BACT
MRHVIIGTSAAGLAAAEVLRAWDREGSITLISEEEHLPYSRPLLTYLLGREISRDRIFLKPADYFATWGFTPLLGEAVVRVDPGARTVELTGGTKVSFDRLLIASGANPRLPGIPGEDLAGVFTLRHLRDVPRLEMSLSPGARVAVVGAGPVGLKVVDALVRRGHQVALIEVAPRVLPLLLDNVAAGFFHRRLADLGVELFLEARPTAILEKTGRARGLVLADGRKVPADLVLMATGVRPRTEFLDGTGLAGPAGIAVDQFQQTKCPLIYAAGDCALPRHVLTREPGAYQIWPAAVAQGRVAGANMAGAWRRYEGVLPQNSVSLGGLKVISGGLGPAAGEGLEIVRELDERRGAYRRLAFQEGRLVGVTLVGQVEQAGIYFQIMAQKLPVRALPADPRGSGFHPGRLWG